ncbi:DUF4862 family protein [Alloscardovia theropitheci]|uniref:DUF4862 family protein n=1 Tax=Alloscardovia theropitheci TaxID=2496842 RepID=A0A4R0QS74_9BIFI|nr:DUF4862 family protein [Alloscardovia theropitheci]TCD54258.1 DUF4862 family protein [Alloscardovia theropitheci]
MSNLTRDDASKHAAVVGVYASQPVDQNGREQYYDLLSNESWIRGAEIPFPGELAYDESRKWLASHLPSTWHSNVCTLIPGTMQTLGKNPLFGLASPDDSAREQALDFMRDVHRSLRDFNDLRSHRDISFIEIHTAPKAHAISDAMRRSLEEITQWDWDGARLVIEHCDKYIENQAPEKGFLSLEEEITLARECGVGITINWGRSAVEGRSSLLPREHIRQCVEADVLTGVMFSGAGPDATSYGYEWIDGHLPMNSDESHSLLDPDRIHECVAESMREPRWLDDGYVGVKVCVPTQADLSTRLSYMKHVYEEIRYGIEQ